MKEGTGPTSHLHDQLPSHFPPPPEIKNAERKERAKPYESKQKSSSSRYTTAADDQQPPPTTTTAMAAAQTSLQISTPPAVYSHGHPLKATHQKPLRLQVRLQILAYSNFRPSIFPSLHFTIPHWHTDQDFSPQKHNKEARFYPD